MPKFFVLPQNIREDKAVIVGEDVKHIALVLRKLQGDSLVLCDTVGYDYSVKIEDIAKDIITVNIIDKIKCEAEPNINVTLYQAMVKGEKSDYIIQKGVELGVNKIVFFDCERCVSRPDEKSTKNKFSRWQSISQSAAKQSGRGIIPTVEGIYTFKNAVIQMAKYQYKAMLYEGDGTLPLKDIIAGKSIKEFAFMIGPEGGFTKNEVDFAKENDIIPAGLGKRILRTETASGCVLSALMYETGNL